MKYVLDACVALKWVLPEPDSSKAVALRDDFQRHIHELLARNHQIAVLWCVEDVQQMRPDLTADQGWEVLEYVDRHHDPEYGITWAALEGVANDLFGSAPETNTTEEK